MEIFIKARRLQAKRFKSEDRKMQDRNCGSTSLNIAHQRAKRCLKKLSVKKIA
jgi:hypothetical protein